MLTIYWKLLSLVEMHNFQYFVWLRQDSELQSVSSHNDTTDDNQSRFTESSSHYSNTYRWLLLKFLLREMLLVFLVTIDTFDIALLCPDIEYQLLKTPKHVKCWALVLQLPAAVQTSSEDQRSRLWSTLHAVEFTLLQSC